MAASITTQVTCPMHEGSCGEMVTATIKGATAKVAACTSLLAQGWTGPQLVTRPTGLDRYVPAQTVLQHRDGLVVFA